MPPDRTGSAFKTNGAAYGHWPEGYSISYDKRSQGVTGFNVVYMTTADREVYQDQPRVWKYRGLEYTEVGRDHGAVYLESRVAGHRLKLDVANRRLLGGQVNERLTLLGQATYLARANWGYRISFLGQPTAPRPLPSQKHPIQGESDFQQFRSQVEEDYRWSYANWELRNPREAKIRKMSPGEIEAFRQQEIADNQAKITERNRSARQQAEARQQEMRDEIERNRKRQGGIQFGKASPGQRTFSASGRTAKLISYDGGEFRKVGENRWISHNFKSDRFTEWDEKSKSSQYLVLARADNGMLIQFKMADKRIWRQKSVSDKKLILVGIIRAVE